MHQHSAAVEPFERLARKTTDYEGLIPSAADFATPKDLWILLQSLTATRPVSRGRPTSSEMRERNATDSVKEKFLSDMHFAFLDGHSPSLRSRLIRRIEIFETAEADIVYRVGSTEACCFFLLMGKLLLFTRGSTRPLLEISPGASFGHGHPFSGERSHVATVVAKTRAVLGRLRYSDMACLALETPDNDFRFLRRMIGNIEPFISLAERDYHRILPIFKIAKLGAGTKIAVHDKVAILCEGEVYGYFAGEKFPMFFADRKFLFPCGVLDALHVISPSAVCALVAWSDFRKLLVSDIAVFYAKLTHAVRARLDLALAKLNTAKLRPDFDQKTNQVVSDLTLFVRDISLISDNEIPKVAHAAWVSALRRIEECDSDGPMPAGDVASDAQTSNFMC